MKVFFYNHDDSVLLADAVLNIGIPRTGEYFEVHGYELKVSRLTWNYRGNANFVKIILVRDS